jgi:hypothetical protein
MLDKIGNESFAINHLAYCLANVLCVPLQFMLGPQLDIGVDQSGEQLIEKSTWFFFIHRITI